MNESRRPNGTCWWWMMNPFSAGRSYCLAAEGHTVTAVSAFADAVDEARRRSLDAAFVDLRLGDDNGMDLIPSLLADSPRMKIVVITAGGRFRHDLLCRLNVISIEAGPCEKA